MKKQKGFTLIELIVVMAVFLVIIGVALGIFISIVQNQKRLLDRQELLNQASYFMEYMSKGLRMAVKDNAGVCVSAGSVYETGTTTSSIKFINASDNNACQEFYLDGSGPNNSVIKERKNSGQSINVTSANLKINSLTFAPIEGENLQPRVTILLNFEDLKVQTTVSQRNISP